MDEAAVKQAKTDRRTAKSNFTKHIEDDEAYETEEKWLSECQESFMRLEVDAKMFIESVEQCGSKNLAENGDLSKEKESALPDGVLENEGIPNMQPPTPSPSEEPHTSGMTNIQTINQTLPEINAEKAKGTSEKEINSVQKADDKQNPVINKENTGNTSQTGACTFKSKNQSYLFSLGM